MVRYFDPYIDPGRREVPVDGWAQLGVGTGVVLTVLMMVGTDVEDCMIIVVGGVARTDVGVVFIDVGSGLTPVAEGEEHPAVMTRIAISSIKARRRIFGDSESSRIKFPIL
jgi:hypothetical protein